MSKKKEIRKRFRDDVFSRDKFKCVMCGFKSSEENCEKELDAHHITNRNDIVNGGYVKENGISLCEECHKKAEEFHSTGTAVPGFSIEDLYTAIKSSLEKAKKASLRL